METTAGEEIKITNKKIKSIGSDPEKTANAINLVYVNDTDVGITREKAGEKFQYFLNGKKVNDDEELLRIKHLVLPPAWTNVWICPKENGHLQATGLDIKGRKQYKYHSDWNKFRNQTKFYRLHEFGKVLPAMRLKLENDLSTPTLGKEKVLAAIVSLMERTNIRVGNNFYEKLYGSYGLTTLKDKHVQIDGNKLKFSFKGKKGVFHDISIKNNKLSKIVKQCRDIPGKELFQYFDENGVKNSIDSGMVNDYIKTISGGSDFTAKDFRTWAGTVQALLELKSLGCCETQVETKKKIVEALDSVSSHLGNTRTVCKKYYVHPLILSLYETNELEKYTTELDKIEKDDHKTDLTSAEKAVMKILETN
ncbi:MAG: DNA topoisomerase IB [Chitinophagaceae bacterium]|nr:DNA topoisomerase IB [Chitinophagaceae bacterium]